MASVQQEAKNTTMVTLKNNSLGRLKLDRFRTWYGKPVGGLFPDTILPESEIKFTYVEDGQPGCTAAVQYSGMDTSGNMVAVLLAWDAPDPYGIYIPNRVYAISRAQSEIDNMSWEEILLVVEKAPTTSSDTYVKATIVHAFSPDRNHLEAEIDLPLKPCDEIAYTA